MRFEFPNAAWVGLFLATLIGAVVAAVPAPQLLKDVNPLAQTSPEPVHSMVDVNGTLFFCACDLEAGEELWKSNGSPAGTVRVKDILPGRGSSFPKELAAMGGNLYFVADDGVHGFQLWKSNGTDVGTVMVKDFGGDTSALAPRQLTGVGNTLFFYLPAEGPTDKVQLWKSDGTESGTVPVDPLPNLGAQLTSDPLTDFMEFRGKLVFVSPGWIWTSDGTSAGTIPISSTGGYGFYGGPRLIATATKLYYFITWHQGYALLSTDGSGEAQFLKEMPEAEFVLGAAALGDTLFFTGTGAETGSELWKSDGTAAGTVWVKDILPNVNVGYPESSSPRDFEESGGIMYFSAADANLSPGRNLWKTDGTPTGTVMVRDMNLPIDKYTVSINGFLSAGNRLYFTRVQTGQETQLWSSDGTARGTTSIKPIKLGFSGEAKMAVSGERLFVVSQGHLWTTDGTPRGTLKLTNLMGGSGDSIPLGAPGAFTVAGSRVFFTADDGKHGSELWTTKGSASTTMLVRDIVPGRNASYIHNTLSDGDRVFEVIGDKKGLNLWISDGTARGTLPLLDLTPRTGWQGVRPRMIGTIGGQMYFLKDEGGLRGELWKSDGTKRGTMLVRPDGGLPSADLAPPATANTLFFQSNSASDPNVLCRTDGSAQTTWKIDGVFPRFFTHDGSTRNLCRIGNIIYFYGSDSSSLGLWRSDGTTAGTYMLKSFQLSLGGQAMSQPIAFNGKVLMMFNGGPGACGLWISDGTAEGTQLVSNGLPGARFGHFFFDFPFVHTVERVFFLARHEGGEVELWKSDGTVGGTEMVRDGTPANAFPRIEPETILAVGSTLYFPGTTDMEGTELWKSDGTANGTVLVRDLTGDSAGSNPSALTLLGSQLLFRATTGEHGNEPRVLDVSADLPASP